VQRAVADAEDADRGKDVEGRAESSSDGDNAELGAEG